MQPTQYPINFHELYANWRHFVEQGSFDDQVDPLIATSWRRCLPKHNPYTAGTLPRLSEDALQALRVRQFDLIAIARPFMEDIYQCVERSGYLVLLMDANHRGIGRIPFHWHVLAFVGIVVTGFSIVYLVNRVSALTRFYEQRPRPDADAGPK